MQSDLWIAVSQASPQSAAWSIAVVLAASIIAAIARLRFGDPAQAKSQFTAGIACLSQLVAPGLLSILLAA